MIELTYAGVAAIVVVTALIAGTLVAWGIPFLTWTDRWRADREERSQARARVEFLGGFAEGGKVLTRRPFPGEKVIVGLDLGDSAASEGMILRTEGGEYLWPPEYREQLRREFLDRVRSTQPEKEGITDDE